jgi:CDGSH-type Zn-finger protein
MTLLRRAVQRPAAALNRAFAAAAAPAYAQPTPEMEAKRIGSLWHKWFPYDPIPVSPQMAPYVVYVKGGHGEVYWWCACGESTTQPWADGTCKCSVGAEGWRAIQYMPRRDGYKLLCGSKMSVNKPKYDGTCTVMWADHNPGKTCVYVFVFAFVNAVWMSYLFHP